MATLQGRVFDKETGKPLAFAVVAVTDASGSPLQPVESVTTNADGKFSISTTKGTHLGAKYVGYARTLIPIAGTTNFDFSMQAGYNLPTVEIVATKLDSKDEEKKIPNWVYWTGGAVLLIGASILVYKIVKSKKNK